MQCGGNGGGVLLLHCEHVWAPRDSQPLGLGAGEAQARGAPGCSVWRLLEKAAPSQPVGQAPGWPPDPPPCLAPPQPRSWKGRRCYSPHPRRAPALARRAAAAEAPFLTVSALCPGSLAPGTFAGQCVDGCQWPGTVSRTGTGTTGSGAPDSGTFPLPSPWGAGLHPFLHLPRGVGPGLGMDLED